jgi:hypothetical protein
MGEEKRVSPDFLHFIMAGILQKHGKEIHFNFIFRELWASF